MPWVSAAEEGVRGGATGVRIDQLQAAAGGAGTHREEDWCVKPHSYEY